jgi:integrase
VVALFDNFSKELGRGGRRRSTRTIALTHRVLSLALSHAVRVGVIARNPAEGARDDLPRGEASPERVVWTLEQLAAFLDATVSDPLYALWALAATTGLRRGELCGLRWDDLDLGSMSLTVRRCLVMVHGVATESTPKTSAGQRTIGLDGATVAVLKEHRRCQEVEKSRCPTGFWQGDGHVFTDDIGRALVPERVTKEFTRAVRRAGLPQVRLHDTRHSHVIYGGSEALRDLRAA